MTATQTDPDWLRLITRKRGAEIASIVFHLLNVGMRRGDATLEDAHGISVTHPNIYGASAKYLHKVGFIRGEIFRGTTKQSHGHYLRRWILEDHQKARRAVDGLTEALLKVKPRQLQQTVMF